MKQIPLNFEHKTEYLEEDFIVSPSNEEAYKWLNQKWNSNFLCIFGGKGKTHLAHIWAENNSAKILQEIDIIKSASGNIVIDNADKITDEVNFFHLFNKIKEEGGYMLLTAQKPPSKWNIRLPDLRSRLNTVPAVEIYPPDDMLLEALLIKHFSDRQLRVGDPVIKYITARIERSFSAVEKLVNKLDRLSLDEKRNITIPLAKKIL